MLLLKKCYLKGRRLQSAYDSCDEESGHKERQRCGSPDQQQPPAAGSVARQRPPRGSHPPYQHKPTRERSSSFDKRRQV